MLTAASLDPEAWEQVGTDVFPFVTPRCHGVPTVCRPRAPENDETPRIAALRRHAPKRTRTSTRLSRTRPSTRGKRVRLGGNARRAKYVSPRGRIDSPRARRTFS